MSNTKELVQEILSKPQAKLIVGRVQDELTKEQKKRREFYDTIDDTMKAEFVNGEIIIHSPVVKEHNEATQNLLMLLKSYVILYDLGFVGVEKIMVSLTRNDYEPDLCFFKKERAKDFEPKQKLFPFPDFVVEILSDSTRRHDRKTKFADYEEHGISEYCMIEPEAKTVEQYQLRAGRYEQILKAAEGTIHSWAVSGFSIPIPAIFDEKQSMLALKEILSGNKKG